MIVDSEQQQKNANASDAFITFNLLDVIGVGQCGLHAVRLAVENVCLLEAINEASI